MKNLLIIFVIFLLACSCEKNTVIDDIITKRDLQLNSIHTALITKDNDILIAGVYDSKTTFIKTDADFGILWRKDNYEWGTNYSEGGWGGAFYSVNIIALFQNDNKNYVCIGSTAEGGDVIWMSAIIIELNQYGEELKKIEIQDFSVNDALHTSDNGYLLMGNKLIKLDNNLDILWEKEFTDHDYMETKIINNIEGGYAVTGINNGEIFLKRLDQNGNELWANEVSYNKNPFDDAGYDLIQLDDQGFIIIGRTRKTHEPYDIDCYIIRTDFPGDTIWTKKFGGNTNEWLNSFIYSSDDEFIIQGTNGFPNDSIQQSILLDIDLNGQIINSGYMEKFEILLYNPSGYFLKACKLDENNIKLSKIPFSNLFIQESNI